jgi:putative ABC transport system permease protein
LSRSSSYLTAAALAVGAAIITTTVALYLPGRRALTREVVDERRELESGARPAWLRMRLDVILLATAAAVSVVTFLTGGYKPAPAAEAASISLSFYVLLAPLLFWVGAALLAVRGVLAVATRWGRRATVSDFRTGMVRRTLALSVLRRPHAAASGIIALSLAIAFGVSLATFVGTYQAEKLADAHFVIGGDVRVTAGVQRPGAPSLAGGLRVAGVQEVTPVATSSMVVGTETRSLAAVDPVTFDRVARTNPSFINGMTPAEAMAALASDPKAALIDTEIARTFNIQVGDTVRVQIPNRVTSKPVPFTFRAVAAFTRFPGFPPGVDLVTGIGTYQAVSGTTAPDFYLLATDGTDATNAAVVSAIRSGPGSTTGVLLESTGTAINQEQSTLSALNVSGLGRLEIVYTLLMSALGITIFVFGILLQRRKENVTMRALGMRMQHLQSLIIGEAGVVTAFGLVIGAAVGLVMALMSVQILQPVFTIPPAGLSLPWDSLALLAGLVVGAMTGASLVAGVALRRAHLVEILREE